MSEFGKLRTPNTSGGSISAGVIIDELDLVNKLLARAEKAEAALESAQKMADHWEAKAGYWKLRAEEAETARSNRSVLLGHVHRALDAADIETLHPVNEAGECKLMTLAERVQGLAKSRDDWKRIAHDNEARAEKAEAELESAQKMCDHWERKAGDWKRIAHDCDSRAVKAETEKDEWKSRAEKAEASVKALHDAVDYLEGKSQLQEFRLEQALDKLKRQRELANPVDWERVRIEVAGMFLANGQFATYSTYASAAAESIRYADALVAELQKKEVQG